MNRRGFTLIELLVAILVLLAVLLASGQIFSATSKVAGLGEANSDVNADLQAFERSIRNDLSSISRDGFLMIRTVAVRNDVRGNDPATTILLDSTLPADHIFRCDQLLFFREGISGSKNYGLSSGANNRGRSAAHRVYYGHAFQLGDAALPPVGSDYVGVNPNTNRFQLIPPWADSGTVGNIPLSNFDAETPENEAGSGAGTAPLPAVPANEWLFSRQAFMMADDGGVSSSYRYLDGPFSFNGQAQWGGGVVVTPSIFVRPPLPFNPIGRAEYFGGVGGRVDAAGMSIRGAMETLDDFASQADGNVLANNHYWRRQFVSRYGLYWPRGEARSPSTSRVSFPLTRHIIAASCSDFQVEWAWADGTGAISQFPNEPFLEQGVTNLPGQSWYPRLAEDVDEPLFIPASATLNYPGGLPILADGGERVFADFEQFPTAGELSILGFVPGKTAVYEAYFGTNSTQPFVRPENPTVPNVDVNGDGEPDDIPGVLDINDFRGDWTPWPTAIRVTATIHDRLGRLAAGQTTQFVVTLPRRGVSE